jgi:hypothetical protein
LKEKLLSCIILIGKEKKMSEKRQGGGRDETEGIRGKNIGWEDYRKGAEKDRSPSISGFNCLPI